MNSGKNEDTAEAIPEVEEATSPQKKKGRKKRPRGRVHVYDNWCKGCGLCIAFCPQKVFEANGEGRPIVANPEACTACMWCTVHCPDFAIVVERLDGDEE